jgi:hypothetical protein
MTIEDGFEDHKFIKVLGPLDNLGGPFSRRRSANALLLRSRCRIPLRAWIVVSCVVCVVYAAASTTSWSHLHRSLTGCVCVCV